VNIAGLEVPSDSPVFLAALAVHVPLGLVAVLSGAGAMLTEKKHGIHTRFGSIYFWSLGALFSTSAILAVLRWSQDYHLFTLGALAFLAALIGRATRRHGWTTAVDLHIIAMGISYIAMITAFYVDNRKSLPIWRDMPPIAYWLMPGAVGLPIMITALLRSPRIASTG
jgi:hypothetical protein